MYQSGTFLFLIRKKRKTKTKTAPSSSPKRGVIDKRSIQLPLWEWGLQKLKDENENSLERKNV